jgi:hypothetical protein
MKQGIINGVHNGIIPQYNKIVTRGSIVAANNRRRRPVPGMLQWLRADQRITYNGLNASVWGDMSGHGYDIIQATASKQPLPSNNIINGHPAVYFDGGDNMYGAFASPISQPITVFVVWSTTVNAMNFVYDGSSNLNLSLYCNNQDGYMTMLAGGGSKVLYAKPQPFSAIISTGIFNGASSANYENGILKGTGTVANSTISGMMMGSEFAGTSYFLTGYVAERIVYARLLTSREILQNHDYLKTRYAL